MTYSSLLLSPWTLIAVVLTVVAFLSLVLGKYDRKTVIRTTLLSFLVFYGLTVYGLYKLHYGEIFHMQKVLDRQYDYIQNNQPGEIDQRTHYVIAISTSELKEGYSNRIYIGNYSSEPLIEGRLVLRLFDESGKPLAQDTVVVTDLPPGEKNHLVDIETGEAVANYQYQWTSLN